MISVPLDLANPDPLTTLDVLEYHALAPGTVLVLHRSGQLVNVLSVADLDATERAYVATELARELDASRTPS